MLQNDEVPSLSPSGLQTVINRFVKIQAENGYIVADDFYLLDDDDSEEAEDIEVPKSLGDIFESVAGAIFLDSKLSLVKKMSGFFDTWRIGQLPKSYPTH
jgi:dsRNA-specific ribonuclease